MIKTLAKPLKNLPLSILYPFSSSSQSSKPTSYYLSVLNLRRNFTQQQLKSSYLQLVKKYHPDLSKQPNSSQKFQQIQQAYDYLSNPTNVLRQQQHIRDQERQYKSTAEQKSKQFSQRFYQHYEKKQGKEDQSMNFSYNLYKKHHEQMYNKKKDYVKYPGHEREQWAHKDEKGDQWKGLGAGGAILGILTGSIYIVNSR